MFHKKKACSRVIKRFYKGKNESFLGLAAFINVLFHFSTDVAKREIQTASTLVFPVTVTVRDTPIRVVGIIINFNSCRAKRDFASDAYYTYIHTNYKTSIKIVLVQRKREDVQ